MRRTHLILNSDQRKAPESIRAYGGSVNHSIEHTYNSAGFKEVRRHGHKQAIAEKLTQNAKNNACMLLPVSLHGGRPVARAVSGHLVGCVGGRAWRHVRARDGPHYILSDVPLHRPPSLSIYIHRCAGTGLPSPADQDVGEGHEKAAIANASLGRTATRSDSFVVGRGGEGLVTDVSKHRGEVGDGEAKSGKRCAGGPDPDSG